MTAKRDYYEVLGVSKTTPINEIKSQYRKLALKFHPDRNKSKDAGEHFKEISEAYAVISDPEKRSIYDQHGHAGVDGRYSTDDIFQGASANFSDILEVLEEDLILFFNQYLVEEEVLEHNNKRVLIFFMRLLSP